ncbi:PolC-type DNA polymerase III [Phocicoccus pinnipedialis]|uniref:DNA polymerase III PolC-type n=2 Tax=Bacteria TaxID=2 RepID=A0A6V7RGM3_9BACL|nr:DNA polymerase-3 subunit alpha (Gram-positive type) [Jeotgalicoccus pinnipedialis]CAD2076731.1 DNA polymerase III PolC-type [Jeotgalicoccus pinnipedialis]
MNTKEQFKVLLTQLNMESTDNALNTGQLKRVVVDDNNREWQLHIHFETLISYPIYQQLKVNIHETFSMIANVELIVTTDDYNDNDVYQYLESCLEGINVSPNFLRQVLNTRKTYQDDVLRFIFNNDILKDYFDKNIKANLLRQYTNLGINIKTIESIVDIAVQQEKENSMDERLEEERIKFLEEFQKAQSEKYEVEDTPVVKQIGKHLNFDGVRPLENVIEEEFNVKVEGVIFSKDVITTRTGKKILNMKVTDYTDSIQVKKFGRNGEEDVFEALSKGDWVIIEGNVEYDEFARDLVLNLRALTLIDKPKHTDSSESKRVELHLHTMMSAMDGVTKVQEFIDRAEEYGHTSIAITDHNNVQAFPEAYNYAKGKDINVIFGMEANLVNDGARLAFKEKDVLFEDSTFVVFDVETTGLSSRFDKIIELAAVKVQNGEIVDKFESFINPHEPLSEVIKNLTGITDGMLVDAPEFKDVIPEFKEWVGDAIFVAHNATFDMGFIDTAYEKLGFGPSINGVIDTLEITKVLNKDLKRHNLAALSRYYNVELVSHHRAIYDAEATGYIFIKMLQQLKEVGIKKHSELNTLAREDAYKLGLPDHAIILVKTQEGLKNLFKIVSDSLTNSFYQVPRVRRSVLEAHREGLLIGSACDNGEVFSAMLQKSYEAARDVAHFYDYLEIFPKSLYNNLFAREMIKDDDMYEEIVHNMIALGKELGIPVVATGNVHYLDPKDKLRREIIIKGNPGNPLSRSVLPDAHFRTTTEMLKDFDFLGEELAFEIVVKNTNLIADMIEDVEVIKKDLYTPKIENAEQEIEDMTYANAKKLYGENLPKIIKERLEFELKSIIGNGFSVVYLISQKLVKKSLNDGYLVGSRGSVGSSLVATMMEITEVNPMPPHYICPKCKESHFFNDGKYSSGYDLPDKNCEVCDVRLIKEGQDIPFETFLGFEGDKVPDIDLNFSGEYQAHAHAYTKELFGEEYVYRAGTISTLADKTAFGYVNGYMNDHGLVKRKAEIDRLASEAEGIKRTTGQHPGGIIVIPDYMDVFDFTPIQYPADDTEAEWRTTHFDFHSIDENVLKLDILGHVDPTMIRMLEDLTGLDPKTIPTNDERTMSLFKGPETLGVTREEIHSETGTYGVPEFGTNFVREMLVDTKPSTFGELVQISGLSHGTDVWLGNAQDLIRKGICDLSSVIGCRDDIMVTLMYKGLPPAVAFQIMESVRKGRGLRPEWIDIMKENGVEDWYIESCKKIKYMFPKAHASAYVLMAFRIAYYKVHYPKEYYATYLSVRATDFDLLLMTRDRSTVSARVKEMKDEYNDLSKKERDLLVVLEVVNEMLHRDIKMKPVDIEKSDPINFIIDGDSLIPPFVAVPGLGAGVARTIAKVRETEKFISKEDLNKKAGVSQKVVEYLTELGSLDHLPDKAQLSIFDI